MNSTIINLGPQHPASHGVLRLILEINGEYIKKIDSQVGYLHRGTEKLIKYRDVDRNLPYFDRLDYVSTLSMENSYSLIMQQIYNIDNNFKNNIINIILLELGWISNHLMATTTNAMDIGAITPFLWCFELRELIFQFMEQITGARLHVAVFRPGDIEIEKNLNNQNIYLLNKILSSGFDSIEKIFELLENNRVWKNRVKGVGVIDYKTILNFSQSGPIARSAGLNRNLKNDNPWFLYNILNNNSKQQYIIDNKFKGDIYSRFNLRLTEILKSLNIITKCLDYLTLLQNNKSSIENSSEKTMENTINDFLKRNKKSFILLKNKNSIDNIKNYIYQATETPKGEFGIIIKYDNKLMSKGTLERLKLRSPTFYHLNAFNLSKGLITDCLANLGSLDIVLGEVDR